MGIEDWFDDAVDWGKDLGGSVSDKLDKTWGWFKNATEDVYGVGKKVATTVYNDAKGGLTGLSDKLFSPVTMITLGLLGFAAISLVGKVK